MPASDPKSEEPPSDLLLPQVVHSEAEGLEWIPGWLKLGLVLSGPNGVRQRTTTSDERPQELLEQAVQNLREQSSEDDFYESKALPGLRMYFGGDGHAAARALLLKELVHPWPLGGVLAMMPAADQLIVMPVTDLGAVAHLPFLAQSGKMAWSAAKKPISDQLFWFDGEHWAHVPVKTEEESMEVHPPPSFVQALHRMAAVSLHTVLPEA